MSFLFPLLNCSSHEDINSPLTFTAKSASNAVCLSSIYAPDDITLRYNKNNTGWNDYILCSIITLN